MPKHRMNVCTADTPSSVEVMIDAPLIASIKLTKPKMPPSSMLAIGPMTIAPIAIGTVRNDIYSGPTGTLPRPMSFITTSMATRIASCVSVCTLIFCLGWVFIFNPPFGFAQDTRQVFAAMRRRKENNLHGLPCMQRQPESRLLYQITACFASFCMQIVVFRADALFSQKQG